MADYVEAARALGMTELGVSDHGPAYWYDGIDRAQPTTNMALSEFAGYVEEAQALKRRYEGVIGVRVGVEADFIEGREHEVERLLGAHALDYTLGSVHYVFNDSVFNGRRWTYEDPEATFRDYYRQVALAANTGLFDTLSHLSVIEVFAPPIPEALASELYPWVADAVAASGCLVEVNTSGYRKMGGDEPFPNRRLLRLLVERGVPITFGSDCHRPEEVGHSGARVRSLLAEVGLGDVAPRHVRNPRTGRGPLLAFLR